MDDVVDGTSEVEIEGVVVFAEEEPRDWLC